MGSTYALILYKTDAVIHERPTPTPHDFTHAVLMLFAPGRDPFSLEYTSHGVQNEPSHHYYHGDGLVLQPAIRTCPRLRLQIVGDVYGTNFLR